MNVCVYARGDFQVYYELVRPALASARNGRMTLRIYRDIGFAVRFLETCLMKI